MDEPHEPVSEPLPPPPQPVRARRIVLLHTTGRYAGFYSICGLSTEWEGMGLPLSVSGVQFMDGHVGTAKLTDLTPVMVLYTEHTDDVATTPAPAPVDV